MPDTPQGRSQSDAATERGARLPVKLHDGYSCQGVDADGVYVTYGDLLSEGERVASTDDGEGNCWGPYGVVVRKADGLWIVAEDVPLP